jgi:hypothetical protein
MTRWAGPLLACALALISAQARAQTDAIAPAAGHPEVDQKVVPSEPQPPAASLLSYRNKSTEVIKTAALHLSSLLIGLCAL